MYEYQQEYYSEGSSEQILSSIVKKRYGYRADFIWLVSSCFAAKTSVLATIKMPSVALNLPSGLELRPYNYY